MDLNFKNSDFSELIQNEKFIELVRSGEESQKFIEELIRQNPGQKKSILYALEFIRINLRNKSKLSPEDFDLMLKNIHESHKNIQRRSSVPLRFYRIAAAILLLISISAIFHYQQLKVDKHVQLNQNHESFGTEGMIVLSDGSKYLLVKNDSLIDYHSASGEIVVKANKTEKRVENRIDAEDSGLNQVVVPFGRHYKIRLSDGTIVHLNAGSRLTFPAGFTGRTREVDLEGEGFFEVSKKEKNPFIVKTKFIDIRVLGTTFNISAYSDENVTTAVLVEGSINVFKKNKILFGGENTILSTGQGYFFSEDQMTSEVRNVNISDFILWKDGLYQFKEIALSDIVIRIRKYYSQKVQIEDPGLAGTLVSGKLVLSDDFNKVMQYLSKAVEGSFELTGEGIYMLKK